MGFSSAGLESFIGNDGLLAANKMVYRFHPVIMIPVI
jgi:hypothetical protein